MSSAAESPIHRPYDEAPAQASLRSIESDGAFRGLAAQHFELVSRGDFVNGLLHRPQAAGGSSARPSSPYPLVILIHDAGERAELPAFDLAADWARTGLAIARIDLPLHGHRASPKLSERLVQGCGALASGERLDLDTRALVEEFARQSVSDLLRTAQALAAEDGIDGQRVAFVGRGIGAWIALWAAPFAPGLRAVALCGGIGRLADPDLDPLRHLTPDSAPADTLFLHERRHLDGRSNVEDQAALYEALPGSTRPVTIDAAANPAQIAPATAEAIRAVLDELQST